MRYRPALLPGAALAGLAAAACQKTLDLAQEPPCPPGMLCEEPIDLWPAFVPILVLGIGMSLVLGLTLSSRSEQPAFAPYRRSAMFAVFLGAAALLLFAAAGSADGRFVLLGWPAMGCTFAAFLLGGTGLRPRGSRLRGLALGLAAYALAGVATTLVTNRGYIDEMDLLAWLLQVLAWPGVLLLHFGGFIN